ncbi:inositol monophosphatase family protein [Jeotgalibacillus sp. S-D1]|uniref:inositol monophosphatase family protein n=1 Tax=Jeotgalibacillus sp. S-D1 TaxID=2552189 RepID=UPI00105A259A|nr:inositol monophosphatase family protein [Jeotgalibacillus sp. S-D1]TDL35181.1 inositol monophosphatase family protein [Jeotgalibacillus sp. S-D1]
MTVNWTEIDEFAKQLIYRAGETIRESFKNPLQIDSKSDANDLVTNMDKEIEKYFVQEVKKAYASHHIMGEEGFGEQLKSLDGTVWIVDPIDGTMNFVHQQRNFAVSVGIYHNGIGMLGYIYDVVLDELYHARKDHGAFLNQKQLAPLKPVAVKESILALNATWVTPHDKVPYEVFGPLVHKVRGTRSYGSAALEMAYIASGRLDGYLTMRLSPWDIAGGKIIIEEVGGVVTDLFNNDHTLLSKESFFAGNPTVHKEIFEQYIQGKLEVK